MHLIGVPKGAEIPWLQDGFSGVSPKIPANVAVYVHSSGKHEKALKNQKYRPDTVIN